MASTQVIEALETLHKELDKMQPAIRQVEMAEQVIAQARKIPEQHLKLMTLIEGQETQFKDKLVGELSSHADQVRNEVGTLIKTATTSITDLTELDEEFKRMLVVDLNGHADQLRKGVSELVSLAGETITNLTKQEEKFGTMRKSLEPLVSQLGTLDLNPRLDKLQDTADEKFGQLIGSTKLVKSGVEGIDERITELEGNIANRLTQEGKTRGDQLEGNVNTIKQEIGQLTDKLIILTEQGERLENQLKLEIGQLTSKLIALGDQGKKQEDRITLVHEDVISQADKIRSNIDQLTAQVLKQLGDIEEKLVLTQKKQDSQKTFTFVTWALIAAVAAIVLFIK